jgi:hypothetical protein
MTTLFQENPDLVQSSVLQNPGQDAPGIGIVPDSQETFKPQSLQPDGVQEAPGLGMSKYISPRQAVMDRINQSAVSKIGAGLAAFGSGVLGRENPVDKLVQQEQRNRLIKIEEGQNNMKNFQEGLSVLSKIPTGPDRDKFVASYAPQMGDLSSAFEAVAKQPGQAERLLNFAKDSPTLIRSLQIDPTGQGAAKLLASPDGAKTINMEIDSKQIPNIQNKVTALLHGAQELDPALHEEMVKRGYLLPSDVEKLNTAAKSNPRFAPAVISDPEHSILTNHETAVYSTIPGMATGATQQEIIKKKAAEAVKPDKPVLHLHTDENGKLWQTTDGTKWDPALGPDGKQLGSHVAMNPAAEQLYKDYANHPQVKEANDLETKIKPLADYMLEFAKTGKSVNANDAALAKAYIAVTTPVGARAYSADRKELSALPDLGDRLGNIASSFFGGKELTDQSRKEMFNYIRQRYSALDAARQEQKKAIISRAGARGVPINQIFGSE